MNSAAYDQPYADRDLAGPAAPGIWVQQVTQDPPLAWPWMSRPVRPQPRALPIRSKPL